MYGNGGFGMMNGLGGYGGMGLIGLLMHLLVWIILLLLVVWIVRTVVNAGSGANAARSILDRRYASGELTRKEYDQMRKDIGS